MLLRLDQKSPREQSPGFTLDVKNQNLWSVEPRNLFIKISPDFEDYLSLRITEAEPFIGNSVLNETTGTLGNIKGNGINDIICVRLCKLSSTKNEGYCYAKKHDHGLLVLERS